jgi:hypothetical protein
MEYRKHAEETMDFIKEIEADGCRFPGSPEEKAASVKIQRIIEAKTGLKPVTEKFVFAPNASLGAIDKLGWVAIALLIIYYVGGLGSAILALAGYVGILVFTFIQIIFYKGWFDFAFKQEQTENIITELLPKSGKTDYTIFLGAHYDSSWCWKLSVKNPKTAMIKMGIGVFGVLMMVALCSTVIANFYGGIRFANNAAVGFYRFFIQWMPALLLPGFFFITQFTSHDKTIGSPGAMDDLSGIGINIQLMKHFAENPDDLPENCRLVNICFAAEEAGLKGSMAYAAAHKNDADLKNAYFINVDSVADPDHFEVVKGDLWQRTRFDNNLINLAKESMIEAGIENPGIIINPVGGCDSTPMCRIGVPSVTVAAQNPMVTDYYHTCNDKSTRFTADVLETGLRTIYNLIQKIGQQRQ